MGKLLSLPGDQFEVEPVPPISRRRQARIKKIQEMHDCGWRAGEIAETLGVSTRTVYLDLKDGRKLDCLFAKEIDQGEIIGRVIRSYEREMRRELRAEQLATNPFIRVAHKRNYITLLEKYVKFLQSVGIVTRVPEELNLNQTVNFEDDEVRAAFYKFMLLAQERGEKSVIQ